MKKRYTFEELLKIIETLRGENGCPWDRKQTHATLQTCMIEEACEVVDGIRILEESGSSDNLCEELGDVLLQVILHSQIAKEESLFTIQDVIDGICEKMIRRHPHVFGSETLDGADAVVSNWEEIKKQEREQKKQTVSKGAFEDTFRSVLFEICKISQKKGIHAEQVLADTIEALQKAKR